MNFKISIHVFLKPGVHDPEASSIHSALKTLAYTGIEKVVKGKYFEISLSAENKEVALGLAKKMTESLLANIVIENYKIEIE